MAGELLADAAGEVSVDLLTGTDAAPGTPSVLTVSENVTRGEQSAFARQRWLLGESAGDVVHDTSANKGGVGHGSMRALVGEPPGEPPGDVTGDVCVCTTILLVGVDWVPCTTSRGVTVGVSPPCCAPRGVVGAIRGVTACDACNPRGVVVGVAWLGSLKALSRARPEPGDGAHGERPSELSHPAIDPAMECGCSSAGVGDAARGGRFRRRFCAILSVRKWV